MATIGVAVAALILTTVIWWRPLASLVTSNIAAVRQSQAELGLYSWPEWPIQDAVRWEVDLEPAITGYEKAIEINPANGSANRRLGQIELSLGEYEDALIHMKAAYDAAPWNNATRQLSGEVLIVNGRVDDGAELWETVIHKQGQLDGRIFWYRYTDQKHIVANMTAIVGN